MATVREVALGLTGICTTVPAAGEGVCERCHRCPNPGFQICWSCENVEGQVSMPCKLIVPVSLYEIPSQLHHELRHYKSGSSPSSTPEFKTHVAALAGYFLAQHGHCIETAAQGGWDVVTSVPSSGDRPGEHPLASAIQMVRPLSGQYERLLDRGSVDLNHNVASDDGFVLRRELHGERVLLIDDTFTSGARAQSAASAINGGGGTVVAIVPIGRVIDPGWGEHVRAYWDRQRRQSFSFDSCCLE